MAVRVADPQVVGDDDAIPSRDSTESSIAEATEEDSDQPEDHATAYYSFLEQAKVADAVKIRSLPDFEEYIVIFSTDDGVSMALTERFSQFRALHERLTRRSPSISFPIFPARKRNKRDPIVVEQRAVDLHKYWNELLDIARDVPELLMNLRRSLGKKWHPLDEDDDESQHISSLQNIFNVPKTDLDKNIEDMGASDIALELRRFSPPATFSGWAGDDRDFVHDQFGASSRSGLTILIKNWEHAFDKTLGDGYSLTYAGWTSGTHAASVGADAVRAGTAILGLRATGHLDDAHVDVVCKRHEVPGEQASDACERAAAFKVDWMYGDACTGDIATKNPFRWYSGRTLSDAIDELEEAKAKGASQRPVIVMFPSRQKQRKFDSYDEAIERIKEVSQELQSGCNRLQYKISFRAGNPHLPLDVPVKTSVEFSIRQGEGGRPIIEGNIRGSRFPNMEALVRIKSSAPEHSTILLTYYDYNKSGYKPFYQFPGVYLVERTTALGDFEICVGRSLKTGTYVKSGICWERNETFQEIEQ